MSPQLDIVPPGTPRAIVWFAAAYFAFAICAFINNLTLIDGFVSQIAAGLGEWDTVSPLVIGIAAFAVRLVVRLALIWLIVWRTSNAARWIVVLFSLPWAYQLPSAAENLADGSTKWLLWLATFLFLVVAVTCLFMRGARVWFARKGQSVATDRAVFD